VRLIAVEVTHPEWRAKKSGISRISRICRRGAQRIPYFRLGFPEEAITEIRLGPTNCEKEDRSVLERFLKKYGYDCDRIRIEPSKVPYRH
jgi:PHP family Zn ribbon phosphoesterase